MRKAEVYRNGILAGFLNEEPGNGYWFIYDKSYVSNETNPSISLTIPKNKIKHHSEVLFPFFFNMLSEGLNRKLQSRYLKIDEKDHFGFLLATAEYDTIGAVTVKQILS